MLSFFDKRGTYVVEALQADGSTASLTIKGVRPEALSAEAFREAAGKPGAEVTLKQSIGKLKENGIRFSATMKELYGSRALEAAKSMLSIPALPAKQTVGEES